MSKRTRSMTTQRACSFPALGPVAVESLEDRRLMSVGPDAIANASTNDTVYDAANHVLHAVYYDTQAKSLNYKGFGDDGLGLAGRVIDSGGDVGQYLSMAQDAGGVLHVAYYDATNADLKYARRDAQGDWTTQTVDSKNTVGLYPSIAIDPRTGKPVVTYYSKTAGDLRMVSLGDGGWRTELLANADDVGRYSSLAFDGNTMGVAYENTTRGSFIYSERKYFGGAFANEYTSTLATVDATTRGGGGNISLVFNNGLPAMSYYDAANADLKYAERSSRGKWSTTTVAAKNSQGMYGDLAFTFNTNQPAIAYYNKTTDSTLLTYRNPDGTWSFETLITGGGRNLTAADGVGANGQAPDLYLVWSDTASGGLKVGTF